MEPEQALAKDAPAKDSSDERLSILRSTEESLPLYVGHAEVTIDDKKRMVIAKGFRNIMLMRSPDVNHIWLALSICDDGNKYLACYDENTMRARIKDRNDRGKKVLNGRYTSLNELDNQGRIVLDEIAREFASLEDKVIIAASPRLDRFNHFEIWNPKKYQELVQKYRPGDHSA